MFEGVVNREACAVMPKTHQARLDPVDKEINAVRIHFGGPEGGSDLHPGPPYFGHRAAPRFPDARL